MSTIYRLLTITTSGTPRFSFTPLLRLTKLVLIINPHTPTRLQHQPPNPRPTSDLTLGTWGKYRGIYEIQKPVTPITQTSRFSKITQSLYGTTRVQTPFSFSRCVWGPQTGWASQKIRPSSFSPDCTQGVHAPTDDCLPCGPQYQRIFLAFFNIAPSPLHLSN